MYENADHGGWIDSPPPPQSPASQPLGTKHKFQEGLLLAPVHRGTRALSELCQESITNAFYNRLSNKILKTGGIWQHFININIAFRDGTYSGDGGIVAEVWSKVQNTSSGGGGVCVCVKGAVIPR